MIQIILLIQIVILTLAHPNKHRETMAQLNAELDKNEMTHAPTMRFTGDELMKDQTVTAGSSIELRCEASGSPIPVFYWTFNGKRIQGTLETNILEKLHNIGKKTIQSGVTVSRVIIPCAQKQDAGVYKCVASNGHKVIQHVAEITIDDGEASCDVKEPDGPKIIEWSDARFENEHNSAQLMCRTNSPSTIAWYNDERELLNHHPSFEVLTNGDLMVKKGEWGLMGIYTCVASNEFGEDRIEVFYYPTALEEPK